MRVSLDWLKDYVDVAEPPAEVAGRLTGAGLAVEGVRAPDSDLRGVVAGHVEAVERHPSAPNLFVCAVDVGAAQRLQIVTGATNVRAGDRVPVAVPGSRIAGGREIGVAEFRGVKSEGMLCSPEELGIPEGGDRILILPPDAPVGEDCRRLLGLDDTVLELELTTNYASHCQSMIGVAIEYAALTGRAVRWPEIALREDGQGHIADYIAIRIDDPDLCPRYAGRLVTGVKVGPSPAWLQRRVRAAGMRPINNVVDVTNFVMMELGQPLHAFDYDRIGGRQIIARRARPGERIVTIDGQERVLDEDVLVIADAERPQVIAGVMGGEDSEVTGATTNVFLEAAVFDGINNRRTSRRYGLPSEASARFTKGVDPSGVVRALDRAAQLLAEIAGGRVVPGVLDVYPRPFVPRVIPLRLRRLRTVLGLPLSLEEAAGYLRRLGLVVMPGEDLMLFDLPRLEAGGMLPDLRPGPQGVSGSTGAAGGAAPEAADPPDPADELPVWAAVHAVSPVPADDLAYRTWAAAARGEILRAGETVRRWATDEAGLLVVVVPTRRPDLAIEDDLAEEVARQHGYDRIEPTLPRGPAVRGSRSRRQEIVLALRRALAGAGLDEVLTHSLTSPGVLDRLRLAPDDPARRAIAVQNPLYEERSVLRTLLAPSLLDVLQYNVNRQVRDLAVFEIARVYRPANASGAEAVPEPDPARSPAVEELRIGIAGHGLAVPAGWNHPERPADFYWLKGVLLHALSAVGVEAAVVEGAGVPWLHPGRSARLLVGGRPAGVLGEVHPLVAAAWDLPGRPVIAEMEVDPVVAQVPTLRPYRPVPRFPAVTRDLAVVLDRTVPAGAVAGVVRDSGGELLEDVRLFDVYEGAPVPPGRRSLAFSLTFRSPERTLTDAEVEEAMARIRAALTRIGAHMRA